MKQVLIVIACSAWLSIASLDSVSAQEAPEVNEPEPATDPFGADWPQGPGRELTGSFCSACHSLAIVKQQGLPRARWDKLLNWMVEEQGMPELPSEQREQVLDYLTTHFGLPETGKN